MRTLTEQHVKISCRDKAQERWLKWMKRGARLGCHQKPERSFFIGGYQMPVCARCAGVFTGYLLAGIAFIRGKGRVNKQMAAAGSLIMFTDWSIQAMKIKESTNKRRFITGIMGGYGIMNLWIWLLRGIWKRFSNTNVDC